MKATARVFGCRPGIRPANPPTNDPKTANNEHQRSKIGSKLIATAKSNSQSGLFAVQLV